MTRQFTATLAASLALLTASNAFADTAEVSNSREATPASSSIASVAVSPAVLVLAAATRATNLQRTPTSIIVTGFADKGQRRNRR